MTFLGLNQPPSFTACDQDHHLCHPSWCHKALPMVTPVSKDSLSWWVLFTCIHWTGIVPNSLSCELQDVNYLVTIVHFPSHTVTSVLQYSNLYHQSGDINMYQTGIVPSLSCVFDQCTVLLVYSMVNCCSTPSSDGKDNGWNDKSWCISQSAYIYMSTNKIFYKGWEIHK